MHNLSKFLKIACVIVGSVSIFAGFTGEAYSLGTRITNILCGLFVITIALIPLLRRLLIFIFFTGVALTSIDYIVDDVGDFSLSGLLTFLLCAGIAIYFASKVRQQIAEFKTSIEDHVSSFPLSSDDVIVATEADLQSFLSSHTLVDEIRTKVAGVTFKNEDGSDRQHILSQCLFGDEIALIFFEYQGSPAYAVFTQHGQIGNLPKDISKMIDRKYDGCVVHGTISSITGGYGDLHYGCNLLLKIYLEKPSAVPLNNHQDLMDGTDNPPAVTRQYPIAKNQIKRPAVDDGFIAEAQWYAARGGTDLVEDE